MYKYYLSTTFLLMIILWACKSTSPPIDPYVQEIEQWRQERLNNLTKADGWTTLIGLYWLKEGSQTVGSDSRNQIVFPPQAPPLLGAMTLYGDGRIQANFPDTSVVKIDGNRHNIVSDADGKPTMMNTGSLFWYVIKRGDKYGIRLKDSLNEARFSLRELPHFSIDKKWCIPARFEANTANETINIANAIGQLTPTKIEGRLFFVVEGKELSLVALDGGPDDYFVIFGDETTGVETYGGGRFLYVPRANNKGETVVDFNKAHNPPCVFSEFATCPLPPQENKLKIEVRSGEKDYHHD